MWEVWEKDWGNKKDVTRESLNKDRFRGLLIYIDKCRGVNK